MRSYYDIHDGGSWTSSEAAVTIVLELIPLPAKYGFGSYRCSLLTLILQRARLSADTMSVY